MCLLQPKQNHTRTEMREKHKVGIVQYTMVTWLVLNAKQYEENDLVYEIFGGKIEIYIMGYEPGPIDYYQLFLLLSYMCN